MADTGAQRPRGAGPGSAVPWHRVSPSDPPRVGDALQIRRDEPLTVHLADRGQRVDPHHLVRPPDRRRPVDHHDLGGEDAVRPWDDFVFDDNVMGASCKELGVTTAFHPPTDGAGSYFSML